MHRHPAAATRPRLLFIDAYDSFTNNIIVLLRSALRAHVQVIKIDRFNSVDDVILYDFVSSFDGIVVGPGPGDPHCPADTGLIDRLWRLPDVALRPILGVCLGFQSLVLAGGGTVICLKEPRHGVIRPVSHCGQSLFESVGAVQATQYHSLHGRLGHDPTDHAALWAPACATPDLQPLAWDLSDDINGPVLMAVRHTSKPFWGVQYHPESICTNSAGAQVVENWWKEARSWWKDWHGNMPSLYRPNNQTDPDSGYATESDSESPPAAQPPTQAPTKVKWTAVDWCGDHDVLPSLCGIARDQTGRQPLLLESGTKQGSPVRAETGRFSIIALHDEHADSFRYWTATRKFERNGLVDSGVCDIADAFEKLKEWTAGRPATGGPAEAPFWGGLIGYIAYEAALEVIDVEPLLSKTDHADLCFVSVRSSMVVDHVKRKVFVQTLQADGGDAWIESTAHQIKSALMDRRSQDVGSGKWWDSTTARPNEQEYCAKVAACQVHIRAGNSYELCLTQQSTLTFESDASPQQPDEWDLYTHLRCTNPAPFAAFLQLDGISILSSSPERFLSWSRDGLCEFRPIKGTVRKDGDMTKSKAEAILKSEKEQAENLMIVDLIRHDLNGVLGGSCRVEAEVPKLMQVEEYATVYQLVSVIRGQLGAISASTHHPGNAGMATGIDVLHRSLPPGSMTGAPKKRSCELLKDIEGSERRVYSGVLGYLDAGGAGDFSVVIRSAIKYADGWRIGAGGAITALSDPLAEFDEMMGKSMAVPL